jgi:uncharacterized protein (TIGR02145 family)
MDNEKGKSLISTGSSNLAKTEKLLSITQKILSELISYYKSVRIGNQEWMTRNLDVDRFRNGDLIPNVKSAEDWKKAGENGQPAWCYYDNDPENGKKYGKLYNWFAVNDSRGLALKGFHVSTDQELTTLVEYLGGEDIAGHKMKSAEGWNSWEDEDGEIQNGNGDNSSGFNALPGGYRHDDGSFFSISVDALSWNVPNNGYKLGWYRHLYSNLSNVRRSYGAFTSIGASVRCLRD